MRLGDGQVQHQLDGRIAEQLIDAAGAGDLELGGFFSGGVEVQVRSGGDLDDGEIFRHPQVRPADRPGPDDADSNFFRHERLPRLQRSRGK
jgi:hypothetical protein